MTKQDYVAEGVLERLGDLENYPDEPLAPYEEFRAGANTYYFTPGGFLYRKDPGSEEVGGFFCGYLTNEVWHHRTDTSSLQPLSLPDTGLGYPWAAPALSDAD
jgi:hypothetical protein